MNTDEHRWRYNRRKFLGIALVGLTPKTDRPVAGSFVYPSQLWGHRLRDHAVFPPPARTLKIPVVIAGGGVAGLSAAPRDWPADLLSAY